MEPKGQEMPKAYVISEAEVGQPVTRRSDRGTSGAEAFRERARAEFAFLTRECGFEEQPLPTGAKPYLNRVTVWYASPTTRIVVEGINWGLNARVALGSAVPVRAFENYDLEDLLALRHPAESWIGASVEQRGSQLEQLHRLAGALRATTSDVLRGDHTIFPALAARVEARRAAFAARRDQRITDARRAAEPDERG